MEKKATSYPQHTGAADLSKASLTRLSPDLYRYTLASPVFLTVLVFTLLRSFT